MSQSSDVKGKEMSKLTVVCAFRNGEKYIGETVESINSQTYNDFDAIFVDDGSVDGSAEIVRSEAKFDYKILTNPASRGLGLSRNRARNRGIGEASGELIANIDADDVMLPNRLAVQTSYFDKNKNLVLLGSSALKINEKGNIIGRFHLPAGDRDCRFALNFYNPFVQSATMIRKSAFEAVGGYELNSESEDFDLWVRLCRQGSIDNIPEPLVKYRIHASSITWSKRREQILAHCQIVNKSQKIEVYPTARYMYLHTWKILNLLCNRNFPHRVYLIRKLWGVLLRT
jgi:glycosyltransferase involved in cell wall biosynthesis